MISVFFIAAFGILVLGLFFWFWWAAPQRQVPPYLSPDEIKQRELQDRVRQTNYQVLAAGGLVATFIGTWVQLSLTSRQWSSDFDQRLRHEQAQGFAEAAKDLVEAHDRGPAFAEQAAQRLYSYTVSGPADFSLQANSILAGVVRDNTEKNDLGESEECWVDSSNPNEPANKPLHRYEREVVPPSAQAAITQLGRPQLAALRHTYAGGTCVDPPDGRGAALNFDHGRFDNFNLSKLDLSCAYMPQVRLRRANLNGIRLFGADLRGARLADWEIPNSPASTGWLNGQRLTMRRIGFDDPADSENTDSKFKMKTWQTYRCFVTDLRNADLRGANLENAAIGGADLTGADLTGANLCGANISRANFTRVRGLTIDMMKQTCVGKPDDNPQSVTNAQPIGLENKLTPIQPCKEFDCKTMDRKAAYALINRLRW